jgi:protein involved in polysaccharide export with SLBB domain
VHMGASKMSSVRARFFLILVGVVCLTLAGCAGQQELPETRVASPAPAGPVFYLLGVGDELAITFPADRSLDYKTPVTPSGTVTVPSGGEVVAVGKTVGELKSAIEEEMVGFLREPAASVVIETVAKKPIFVIGEVERPGTVDTPWTLNISMVLAEAGGLKSSGKPSSVMVVRSFGLEEPMAFRVDVSKVLSGRDLSQDVQLQAYDVVYVPKSIIGQIDEFVDLFFDQIAPAQLFYMRSYDIVKNRTFTGYQ